MTLQGKGFFTFNLSECEGGDAAAIVAAAKEAGLSHVIVKIAEREQVSGINSAGTDDTAPVVQALHAAGIDVWGWHHVCGDNPSGEAKTAVQRTQSLGLKGYVVNAEAEYERPGREAAARHFISALRSSLTVPIALSSFRFPNYHPDFPWTAFLEGCDIHMPKVFWEQAYNAGEQLRESKRQCDALPNARPYVPSGAAYITSGWAPLPADTVEFLDTAQSLELPAVNFFQWDQCRKYLPNNWTTIAGYSWPLPLPENPPDLPASSESKDSSPDAFSLIFLASLNSRKAAQVASLYDPECGSHLGE